MPRNRVGKLEHYMRTVKVAQLLTQGYWESEIVQELSQEWQCSERNVRKYIAKAKAEWKENAVLDLNELRNKYIQRLEHLFRLAYDSKHLKTALDIQKELNRITGMLKDSETDPDQIEVITISKRSEAEAIEGEVSSVDERDVNEG